MAELPQENTIVQYQADGIATDYTVPFYTLVDDDGTPSIDVYVTLSGEDPIPDDDIKVFNVDYTYEEGVGQFPGGTVVFESDAIPPSGSTVTISRNIPADLDVEFANATNFSGANLDAALQKLLLIEQQNKTYALQRNISYVVNAFQEDSNISANTQIPVLGDNQIWKGQNGGVIATTIDDDPDTLRSDLANNQPTTNGASLVGYYDEVNTLATTVKDFLDDLPNYLAAYLGTSALAFKSGMMIDYAGAVAPTGWLDCDGSAVSRTTYADLFTAIGTTWGIGDGSSTFNLPDFRRRVAVGSGGSGSSELGNAVGDTGGEETHTLTIAEMPAHDHTGTLASRGQNYSAPLANNILTNDIASGTVSLSIASQGDGDPHNIIQPSAIVTKIIKI